MAGDHYIPPKTDGTFGLKVNWKKLASAPAAESVKYIPVQEPITKELLETKTLGEWIRWREWRKTHPLAQFAPSRMWNNYRATYLSGKVPSGSVILHFVLLIAGTGFVMNYSRNQAHSFAKNH
ncbi:hypothetical protein MP638_001784 [Amoeboaphelidium occidentale]|nr:hypothetical protein MP638_001784 [Amoeboaphelidium occidentale]